jgi:CheY-like chemotaxis protein
MFKKHILLLVEDDEDIVKLIKSILKSTKIKIYISRTGEDALEIVKTKKIDIALVDYKLPYKNGIIITNEIKTLKDIPIILETGEKMLYENPEMAKDFQFDDVLSKPFDRDTVLGILEKYLK